MSASAAGPSLLEGERGEMCSDLCSPPLGPCVSDPPQDRPLTPLPLFPPGLPMQMGSVCLGPMCHVVCVASRRGGNRPEGPWCVALAMRLLGSARQP